MTEGRRRGSKAMGRGMGLRRSGGGVFWFSSEILDVAAQVFLEFEAFVAVGEIVRRGKHERRSKKTHAGRADPKRISKSRSC